MKIIVPIKRVIDANVRVRVLADGSGVDTTNVKMSINPFCEIAVEAAIRLQEAGYIEEVVVVTVGPAASKDILLTAMAMGADRAILIETTASLQPLAIARILCLITEEVSPDLVILGKQAIDDDNNQTGQMLAGLLGWSQGTFASSINISGRQVEVSREIDTGLEMLSLSLPAVITTDLRLNDPRYVKLPEIIKARKKPLDIINVKDLGVDTGSNLNILKVSETPARQAGIVLDSVNALIQVLKEKDGVL